MTERFILYGSYRIEFDPPPIPLRQFDWEFWHDDYGGPGDGRAGRAASIEAAQQEIDEIEEDLHDNCPCTAAVPAECMAVSCPLRDHALALIKQRAAA